MALRQDLKSSCQTEMSERKPEHPCDAVNKIEQEFLKCQRYWVSETGGDISVKMAFEWRKSFDMIRSPLGCRDRPNEVEKEYESL